MAFVFWEPDYGSSPEGGFNDFLGAFHQLDNAIEAINKEIARTSKNAAQIVDLREDVLYDCRLDYTASGIQFIYEPTHILNPAAEHATDTTASKSKDLS